MFRFIFLLNLSSIIVECGRSRVELVNIHDLPAERHIYRLNENDKECCMGYSSLGKCIDCFSHKEQNLTPFLPSTDENSKKNGSESNSELAILLVSRGKDLEMYFFENSHSNNQKSAKNLYTFKLIGPKNMKTSFKTDNVFRNEKNCISCESESPKTQTEEQNNKVRINNAFCPSLSNKNKKQLIFSKKIVPYRNFETSQWKEGIERCFHGPLGSKSQISIYRVDCKENKSQEKANEKNCKMWKIIADHSGLVPTFNIEFAKNNEKFTYENAKRAPKIEPQIQQNTTSVVETPLSVENDDVPALKCENMTEKNDIVSKIEDFGNKSDSSKNSIIEMNAENNSVKTPDNPIIKSDNPLTIDSGVSLSSLDEQHIKKLSVLNPFDSVKTSEYEAHEDVKFYDEDEKIFRNQQYENSILIQTNNSEKEDLNSLKIGKNSLKILQKVSSEEYSVLDKHLMTPTCKIQPKIHLSAPNSIKQKHNSKNVKRSAQTSLEFRKKLYKRTKSEETISNHPEALSPEAKAYSNQFSNSDEKAKNQTSKKSSSLDTVFSSHKSSNKTNHQSFSIKKVQSEEEREKSFSDPTKSLNIFPEKEIEKPLFDPNDPLKINGEGNSFTNSFLPAYTFGSFSTKKKYFKTKNYYSISLFEDISLYFLEYNCFSTKLGKVVNFKTVQENSPNLAQDLNTNAILVGIRRANVVAGSMVRMRKIDFSKFEFVRTAKLLSNLIEQLQKNKQIFVPIANFELNRKNSHKDLLENMKIETSVHIKMHRSDLEYDEKYKILTQNIKNVETEFSQFTTTTGSKLKLFFWNCEKILRNDEENRNDISSLNEIDATLGMLLSSAIRFLAHST